jgi:hypothetical protein
MISNDLFQISLILVEKKEKVCFNALQFFQQG